MEKVLLNFNLILILIYFYRITRHGLHILQLENYYIDRYAVWMKRYLNKVLNLKTIVLLLIPTIFVIIPNQTLNIIGLVIEALILVYLILSFKKNKEKKPFVVTARIRRVYTTYLILFIILVIISNIFNYKIGFIIANLCTMIAYTFVYIVNLINRPIEKSIRRGFCKKAKKKLEDVAGLKVIGITGSYGKTKKRIRKAKKSKKNKKSKSGKLKIKIKVKEKNKNESDEEDNKDNINKNLNDEHNNNILKTMNNIYRK